MKKVAILFIVLLTSSFVFAQNTYVPDDKFEYALIDLGYDTTLDDSVLTANISGVTYLDIEKKEISDLTGIEAFVALTRLSCYSNKLTSLDVSKNTALEILDFHKNQLTSLDISNNTNLESLDCSNNQLTSLDLSNNKALRRFFCTSNQLTSLDASKNTVLNYLWCWNNKLTSLNMRNGLTGKLNFDATGNPNLTCIETLDPTYATANWTSANGKIDAGVTFSVICGGTDLTTWHVATTGSDGSGSGTETSPLATIQTGINAATEGDTVSVSAGTYKENINYNGKNIVVKSQNGPSLTIIKASNNQQPIVYFHNSEIAQSLLSGFTLSDGGALRGSAIKISDADPTIENCIIKNCVLSNTSHGAISFHSTSATVKNTLIYGTTGGPAIYVDNAGDNSTIINCTIADNHIGLDASIKVFNVKNSIIYNNTTNLKNYGFVAAAYSNIEGSLSGTGNIDSNPKFVKVITTGDEESDYHLADWSPAIGAGTATGAPTTDIEGNPRPNPAGSNPDMGAYENQYGTPQNAPPVIATQSDLTIAEDGTSTATLTATDENGDAITYSAVSDTNAVIVSISSSTLTLTPNANWNGVANIKAYASDGIAKDSTSFKLTVTPVNDAPTLTAITETLSTDEETVLKVAFKGEDVDGDDLTYAYASDTSGVVATHNTAKDSLVLTPVTDFFGNAIITVTVSDGSLSDTSSFTLNVININDAPVLSSIQNQTINEDEVIVVKLTATDLDGDVLTYSGIADTSAVTVTASNDTLKLTPKADWNGTSVITAIVSDGTISDSTSFTLNVNPVQDVPYAFDWVSPNERDTINVDKNNTATEYVFKWNSSKDVDGDALTYHFYVADTLIEVLSDTTTAGTYQDFLDHWPLQFQMLPRMTFTFNVWVHDGTDSVKVTGEPRKVLVNRYENLSTEGEGIPTEFALHENYPNPFNPSTTLRFDLPEMNDVTLTIYNMLGQKVRTFNMQSTPAGYHTITWNATNDYGEQVGAGVYLYQLQAKDFIKTRKMVLLK